MSLPSLLAVTCTDEVYRIDYDNVTKISSKPVLFVTMNFVVFHDSTVLNLNTGEEFEMPFKNIKYHQIRSKNIVLLDTGYKLHWYDFNVKSIIKSLEYKTTFPQVISSTNTDTICISYPGSVHLITFENVAVVNTQDYSLIGIFGMAKIIRTKLRYIVNIQIYGGKKWSFTLNFDPGSIRILPNFVVCSRYHERVEIHTSNGSFKLYHYVQVHAFETHVILTQYLNDDKSSIVYPDQNFKTIEIGTCDIQNSPIIVCNNKRINIIDAIKGRSIAFVNKGAIIAKHAKDILFDSRLFEIDKPQRFYTEVSDRISQVVPLHSNLTKMIASYL